VARSKALRAESIWAALGGLLAGHVLWLVAFTIGNDVTTVGLWGPVVLVVSVAFALGTTLWGRRLQGRGNATLASFAFALPVIPVVLSVAVLVSSYL
jgi:hypothetical protein